VFFRGYSCNRRVCFWLCSLLAVLCLAGGGGGGGKLSASIQYRWHYFGGGKGEKRQAANSNAVLCWLAHAYRAVSKRVALVYNVFLLIALITVDLSIWLLRFIFMCPSSRQQEHCRRREDNRITRVAIQFIRTLLASAIFLPSPGSMRHPNQGV